MEDKMMACHYNSVVNKYNIVLFVFDVVAVGVSVAVAVAIADVVLVLRVVVVAFVICICHRLIVLSFKMLFYCLHLISLLNVYFCLSRRASVHFVSFVCLL